MVEIMESSKRKEWPYLIKEGIFVEERGKEKKGIIVGHLFSKHRF